MQNCIPHAAPNLGSVIGREMIPRPALRAGDEAQIRTIA